MQQGGSQYRRLIAAFQRVFGATIFFGTDTQREKATVSHHARFNFMREARIWYSRDPRQELLPGGFENEIVLSDEFFREVTTHSIPTDLEAAKALSCASQEYAKQPRTRSCRSHAARARWESRFGPRRQCASADLLKAKYTSASTVSGSSSVGIRQKWP